MTLGVQAGFQRERAEARLMLAFRRSLEAVRPIADGNGALIKKGLELFEAERYREILAKCGCNSVIVADIPPPRATLPAYAAMLQAQLEQLDPGRHWQFNEAESELYGLPGPSSPYPMELVVPLEQLYQDWLAVAPAAVDESLRYTAGMVLMGNTPGMQQQAARFLLPIVRSSAERGQAMLAGTRGYSPLLFRPLVEGLEVGLAYHRGTVLHRVAQAHLDAWNMTEDQAYEVAYANLRERSSTPLTSTVRGVYCGPWDDGYDSARMLLPELLQGAVKEGRPVVMVPTRGMLLVCSDKAPYAIDAMLKAAIDAMRDERMVSPRMLRLIDGRWQHYMPSAHSRRLNSLLKYAESNDYKVQKELLLARLAASGEGTSVATYLVGKTGPEQRRTSACTWTRGTPSLLPRTDLLCFADPANKEGPITVPWHAAMPLIGALMQRTDDYPPRYFVDGFPNAVQLDQLADIATETRRDARELMKSMKPPAPEPTVVEPRQGWQALRTIIGRWSDNKQVHAR